MTPEQMDLFRTPPKPKPPTLKAPPPPGPSASSGQDDLMRLAQDRLAAPFRPIRSGDLVVLVRDLQRKDSACPRPGSVYKVVKMHPSHPWYALLTKPDDTSSDEPAYSAHTDDLVQISGSSLLPSFHW